MVTILLSEIGMPPLLSDVQQRSQMLFKWQNTVERARIISVFFYAMPTSAARETKYELSIKTDYNSVLFLIIILCSAFYSFPT